MNLTLAGNQSDFVRNHVNIIPAPVKDVFEKSSDEVPDRTAMKLYRAYYTMISGAHLSTRITVIMKGIVALGSQLPDGPLGKIVAYREFTVIQVSKEYPSFNDTFEDALPLLRLLPSSYIHRDDCPGHVPFWEEPAHSEIRYCLQSPYEVYHPYRHNHLSP